MVGAVISSIVIVVSLVLMVMDILRQKEWYEDRDYWVHYKFVDKPQRKPKMKVVYGGEVKLKNYD